MNYIRQCEDKLVNQFDYVYNWTKNTKNVFKYQSYLPRRNLGESNNKTY
jgi:hypothetical protein